MVSYCQLSQVCSLIQIDIKTQRLSLINDGKVIFNVSISSARNGSGETEGSEKTPRGWHIVRAKIGKDQLINSVFVGRRPTGEVFTEQLRDKNPGRDWILTRILWLSGLEPGFNRLGNVDTMRRYIYIHGCPDSDVMGKPSSHGCIKMNNKDIVQLFDLIDVGEQVLITE
jgi:lipoprotein-anchoring transpeptidase ErfK/SrfK